MDNKLHNTLVNIIKREVKNIINPKSVYTTTSNNPQYDIIASLRDEISFLRPAKTTTCIERQNYQVLY